MTKQTQTDRQRIAALVASQMEQAETIRQSKQTVLDTAFREFLEANNLYLAGSAEANKADGLAQHAATSLAFAIVDGIICRDEMNDTLGKAFGYERKKDGSFGKTPAGKGGQHRRRIVRFCDTSQYLATGKDCPAYLEGVERDDIVEIVNAVRAEEISLFTAHDKIGKLKERSIRNPLAFDPAKIERMADDLLAPGAAGILACSPALQGAYAKLLEAYGLALYASEALQEDKEDIAA